MASSSTTKPDTVVVSKCNVKPVFVSEESKKPYYLTPWDLPSLNYEYIQFGLVYDKPDDQPMQIIVDRLKDSLATTLAHFIPLSGRFVTRNIQHPPSYCVYVDCEDPAGAGFVHAVASNVTISDLLTPTDIPQDIVDSLFTLAPGVPNNRGHTLPLLVVQVTELVDGIFIAFSTNHALVDGTTFWHFINSYSEVCKSKSNRLISSPPVISPWFLNNQVHVPGCHPIIDEGLAGPQPPRGTHRQRVFHFSSKAITGLKMKANTECHSRKISSYQAIAALVWRSVTRARGLRADQTTTCAVPINCRSKLEPPLSDVYFGNCLVTEFVSSTVDELLGNNLGWAAWKLHNQITSCDNNRVRSYLEQFTPADCTMAVGDPGLLFLGNSPRFDMYGNNFGWGEPIAVQWSGDVVDGVVHIAPGRDKGSVDLMVGLFSKFMNTLESDDEFMGALSFVPLSKI